jgi:hypothetical protein
LLIIQKGNIHHQKKKEERGAPLSPLFFSDGEYYLFE